MDEFLKDAIESAVYAMFEGEIPIDDPTETSNLFCKHIEKQLNWDED